MSDTKKVERLRLASLILTASGDPRPAQDVEHVLTLAAQRKARIYIKVPQGDLAFADPDYPIDIQPSRTGMRLFKVNMRRFAAYIRGEESISSLKVTFRGIGYPRITHLELGAWHAESLRTRRHADLDTFLSGLEPHSSRHLARQGWLVRCGGTAALRLYSKARSASGPATRTLGLTASIHRELSDSPDRVEPKDILIDELVAAKLGAPRASNEDDPYRLRAGAPGVYHLYRAAAFYYELLESGQNELVDVENWISGEAPALYQKTITKHAVKLMSPRHRRGSGIPEGRQIKVDPKILASDDFSFICARSRFVTEGLALLFYVARWWVTECNEVATRRRAKKPSRGDVHAKLQQAGFYPTERNALARVVMWPDR